MELIEVLTSVKLAIDESAELRNDAPWIAAAREAGLIKGPDAGDPDIDVIYSRSFGTLEVTLNHRWRDTSRTFQPGPDRTTLTLAVRQGGSLLDSYTNWFES